MYTYNHVSNTLVCYCFLLLLLLLLLLEVAGKMKEEDERAGLSDLFVQCALFECIGEDV